MLIARLPRQGQVMIGQYVLVFFIALAAITAMSVYVRRAIQSRIHGAKQYMIQTIQDGSGLPVLSGYEPYYANRDSIRSVSDSDTAWVAGSSYGHGGSHTTGVQSIGTQ